MSLRLADLNPEQRTAVTTTEGPLLVLAGAGSGKTRVITARIAHLVRACRVPPAAILAVTFTNKAAREMAGRVAGLVKGKGEGPTICTFHSFGVRLLREHIGLLGFRRNFAIFDDHDTATVVRNILEEGDYDVDLLPPKQAHWALRDAKSRGLTPEELATHRADPAHLALGRLLAEYQETLKRMNAVDFDDILGHALTLCRHHRGEVDLFLGRYRYVMVDEYQDTNRVQFELLRALTRGHRNLCVVGDDDQSIYRWRGADPANILQFAQAFPGAATVRLECNYRSTDVILQAANQVISNNAERHPKRLRGVLGPGAPLEWIVGADERDEMEQVVAHLKRTRYRTGAALSDFAILYRSNHQSRAIEEALREEALPYTLVGATRFYDRREVKDALAYLRLIHNPGDEVSLYRVLNFPRRGIGRTSQVKLADYAAHRRRPLIELLRHADELAGIAPAVARSMTHFVALVDRYRARFAAEPLPAVVRELFAELGLQRALEAEKSDPQAAARAAGLVVELERGVEHFARNREGAGLKDFLEHVALVTGPLESDGDTGRDQVTLTTVHAAKGLEFPHVYLIGMADEVFPNKRALAEGAEDEERRLFYVAVTRARRRLTFSMARQRRLYGDTVRQRPSRFLLEISAALFEGETPHGDTNERPGARAERTAEARSRAFDHIRKLKEGAGG